MSASTKKKNQPTKVKYCKTSEDLAGQLTRIVEINVASPNFGAIEYVFGNNSVNYCRSHISGTDKSYRSHVNPSGKLVFLAIIVISAKILTYKRADVNNLN